MNSARLTAAVHSQSTTSAPSSLWDGLEGQRCNCLLDAFKWKACSHVLQLNTWKPDQLPHKPSPTPSSLLMKTLSRWPLGLNSLCLPQLLPPVPPIPIPHTSPTTVPGAQSPATALAAQGRAGPRAPALRVLRGCSFPCVSSLWKWDKLPLANSILFLHLFSSLTHSLYLPFHFYLSKSYFILKFWLRYQPFS